MTRATSTTLDVMLGINGLGGRLTKKQPTSGPVARDVARDVERDVRSSAAKRKTEVGCRKTEA